MRLSRTGIVDDLLAQPGLYVGTDTAVGRDLTGALGQKFGAVLPFGRWAKPSILRATATMRPATWPARRAAPDPA